MKSKSQKPEAAKPVPNGGTCPCGPGCTCSPCLCDPSCRCGELTSGKK